MEEGQSTEETPLLPTRVTWAPVDSPTFTGIVPEVDVDENAVRTEEKPAPPPRSLLPAIPNYTQVSFTKQRVPPPDRPVDPTVTQKQVPTMDMLQRITPEEARAYLLAEVNTHCCWGAKPVEQFTFLHAHARHAFHYVLDTYQEQRSVCWRVEPFTGVDVDGPSDGAAPLPWDLAVPFRQSFHDETVDVEIPHTAVVQSCYHCNRFGQIRCYRCSGRGKLRCGQCRGATYTRYKDDNGHSIRETCHRCFGSGRVRCSVCVGHGQKPCPVCTGAGQLKVFLLLSVHRTTMHSEDVVDQSIPGHTVAAAQGQVVFDERAQQVTAVSGFPNQDINTSSKRLVSTHRVDAAAAQARILRQRHRVTAIPVHEIQYQYRGKERTFWIFGHDHRVHVTDYPARMCFGLCSLL